jgi:hypothetical protein
MRHGIIVILCCKQIFFVPLSLLYLGKKMQPKLSHRDESAWAAGDLAYDLDDTLDMGPIKAAAEGIKPGCNGYAAFITAFSRRVRSKEVSPRKTLPAVQELAQREEVAPVAPRTDSVPAASAVILVPDFLRAAT